MPGKETILFLMDARSATPYAGMLWQILWQRQNGYHYDDLNCTPIFFIGTW
jgi:hypothetical protein